MREKRLSEYIDQLNREERPREHRKSSTDPEYDKLLETVRRVKSLREPVWPEEDFEDRLILKAVGDTKSRTVRGGGKRVPVMIGPQPDQRRKSPKATVARRALLTLAAAAATAAILFTVPGVPFTNRQVSIVKAMEQAAEELKAYHGIIEIVESNALGEIMVQCRREVWSDRQGNYLLKELEGYQKGMITANNGEIRWQLRPEEKMVYLFPAFPDPYRFTFELGKEVKAAKNALSVKKVGEEWVAGREAVILEITPDGGDSYRLWVDKETDLPLQKQSAMQNAVQMKVVYREISFIEEIPAELLVYNPPGGYTEMNTDPEQVLFTMEEAEDMAGFLPVLPKDIPDQYALTRVSYLVNSKAIKLTYDNQVVGLTVVIQQTRAGEELKPDPMAQIGVVKEKQAEILHDYLGQAGVNSIRWQEGEMEYRVYGSLSPEKLADFVKLISKGELILPSDEEESAEEPQIEVSYDLERETNDQKSVDAGHSPWRLDPAFVAQVFANLLIAPEGIEGDYKIPYEAVKIVENNGISAVAEIDSKESIASRIYMKRLVRQDDSGIWTVVGYDPVRE
jgi:outer membrane lipoprotein-sorting protein